MKTLFFAILSSFTLTLLAEEPKIKWLLYSEAGYAFQGYNNVSIPKVNGTQFNFNGDFNIRGPVIPFRIKFGITIKEKNHLFGLYAPLSIRYEGNAPFDINFENSQFLEGQWIDGFYKFNSYRITYRRDLWAREKWTLGVGFTAKIRDASIQLRSGSVRDRKDDLGFVPLLHLYAAYHFKGWSIFFEGDGLAGGPGRAFDIFAGAKIPIRDYLSVTTGYRLLEGGANVDEVFNFTIVHFATLGLFLEF